MKNRLILLFVLLLVGVCTPAAYSQSEDEFKGMRRDIDAVRDSLKVIQNELATIKQLLQQRPAAAPARPQGFQESDVSVDGAPFLGEKDAPVTIVEFSDFQCPFCKRNFQQTFPQILSEYIEKGKVKYVFRDYPLERIHPDAFKAAEAAHCAGEQGKYWEMHDKLLSNQQALKADDLIVHAKAVSLDEAALKGCLDSGRHADSVRKNLAEGSAAGVRGTPAFFFGLTKDEPSIRAVKNLSGAQAYTSFKVAIDTLLMVAGK